jgi:putative Holliday junction resolvase
MPRFLGIDHGKKRIGLAVSDPGATLASPLTTVAASGRLSDQVAAVLSCAKEYDIGAFVVGLPLNMDDTEGDQAKTVRRFGAELGRVGGKPVHYWDERLSSHAAEELLRPAELTRKKRKARLDRVAAQVILQGFLDARTSAPPNL